MKFIFKEDKDIGVADGQTGMLLGEKWKGNTCDNGYSERERSEKPSI